MSNHRKGSKKLPNKALGDVTINDFANSTVTKSRAKKSWSNVSIAVQQMQADNRTWDEKADDFDADFDIVEEENEDGSVSVVMKKKEPKESTHRRKKTSSNSDRESDQTGNVYPIDIWFLISEYVRPEDIGTFGAICKMSLAVVYSAKFWFSLYKRHYAPGSALPDRLQPECMVRLYGLKTCVVRALYFMYAPFANRVKTVTTFEEHPCNLEKRKCVLMWHRKTKNHWLYFFKLKRCCGSDSDRSTVSRYSGGGSSRKPDLIEMLEDVMANQDEGCRILKVTCAHFVAIPPVLGLTLFRVFLPLSQGLIFNRLQLGFSSGVVGSCSANSTDANQCVVVFDPVINVKVLDWWHPMYPHSDSMSSLLNREED